MKIRSDFVTNSSSSSFILSIDIKCEDGNILSYDSGEYSCESNGEIMMEVSPKELGQCSSVDELASLLEKKIYLYGESGLPVEDVVEYSQCIQKCISSMNDIEYILVKGSENYRTSHKWNRQYKYDLKTGQYSAKIYGGLEESEGTGGDLLLNDDTEAEISPKSELYTFVSMKIECDDGINTFTWEGRPGKLLFIKHSPKKLACCSSLSELNSMLAEEFTNREGKEIVNTLGKNIYDISSIETIKLTTETRLGGEQHASPVHTGPFYGGAFRVHTEEYSYSKKTGRYTLSQAGSRLVPIDAKNISQQDSGIVILFDDLNELIHLESQDLYSNRFGGDPGKDISEEEKLYKIQLKTGYAYREVADRLHVGKKVSFSIIKLDANNMDGFIEYIAVNIDTDEGRKTIGTFDRQNSICLINKGLNNLQGRIVLLKDTDSKNPAIVMEVRAQKSK